MGASKKAQPKTKRSGLCGGLVALPALMLWLSLGQYSFLIHHWMKVGSFLIPFVLLMALSAGAWICLCQPVPRRLRRSCADPSGHCNSISSARPAYESPMFFLDENLASRRRHLIAVGCRLPDSFLLENTAEAVRSYVR